MCVCVRVCVCVCSGLPYINMATNLCGWQDTASIY